MPASCLLIRFWPRNWPEPNGLAKLLMVQSQMKPAPLLRIESSAMNATTWLSTGASWIGLSTTRSISTPAANEMTMVAPKASQYGKPHWISCQAMKVENIAISPWAKFRWSIAW